jgi:hypothetical protein
LKSRFGPEQRIAGFADNTNFAPVEFRRFQLLLATQPSVKSATLYAINLVNIAA